MTPVTNCIRRVMELSEKATKGPWKEEIEWTEEYHHYARVTGVFGTMNCDDGRLIAYYRNVTPKLAEALKIAMEVLDATRKQYPNYLSGANAESGLNRIEKIFEGGE